MLQVVFVVMPLHPVRLPGLHWGCSRPGHRLQRRAGQVRLHCRAIPCRGHCRPFHDRAQGEPSWRGQDPAQGLRVIPAERKRGSFKVAPAAALLRRPDLALAAAGALAAAATAHLASPARTLRRTAPLASRGNLRSVRRGGSGVRGGGGVGEKEGRGWLRRALEGSVMWGAAPPAPAPGRTRRRGGAKGERGAGARVSPPPRRATAQGGAGCLSPFTLCAARRRPGRRPGCFVLAGQGRKVPGGVEVWGWGVVSGPVPSLSVPHSPPGAPAGGSPLTRAERPRIKLAGAPRPQKRQCTKPGAGPAASRATLLHVCYGVAEAARPAGAGGSWGKEAQRCWVTGGESRAPPAAEALPAPPAPARSGQRPPGATAEPGKCPRGMLRTPGSLGE